MLKRVEEQRKGYDRQIGSELWQRIYDLGDFTGGRDIETTADGGFIVAGYYYDRDLYHREENQSILLKLNRYGAIERKAVLGGIDFDGAYVVRQTMDGGYAVAGYIRAPNKTVIESDDIYIKKLNADFEIEWEKKIGGILSEKPNAMEQTVDGGFIIVARPGIKEDELGLYLIKLDRNGKEEWQKVYGGEWATSLAITNDNGYIIAGSRRDGDSNQNRNAYIAKLDGEGNKEWERFFGGIFRESASCVKQTSDGGYIVAGYMQTTHIDTSVDFYILKLDPDGELEWEKLLGGEADDYATSVAQTGDSGYVVVGNSNSFPIGRSDIYIVKISPDGELVWDSMLGGDFNDYAYSVKEIEEDGGFVIVGKTDSYDFDYTGIYVIRMDSNGMTTEKPEIITFE